MLASSALPQSHPSHILRKGKFSGYAVPWKELGPAMHQKHDSSPWGILWAVWVQSELDLYGPCLRQEYWEMMLPSHQTAGVYYCLLYYVMFSSSLSQNCSLIVPPPQPTLCQVKSDTRGFITSRLGSFHLDCCWYFLVRFLPQNTSHSRLVSSWQLPLFYHLCHLLI